MGEVYQATDTKLKRQVAIKVLPEALASDGERLARFQREAEVLASLNHPNIAAIYGLEDAAPSPAGSGGAAAFKALVMELIEGPTLADRIADGAIPVAEALPIAKQIAEALEAAHEQGIIHRDLKPANVKVRPDGTVKVLDFGLAKAMEPASAQGASAGQAQSQMPTITTPAMTRAGMVLGTAAYMSPEQAKGRPADKRSDVWAFGCVLYEMFTGKRAFDAEDVSETLASVLAREPDWSLLPGGVSPTVVMYLRRCLNRHPKQRIGDVQDLRLALEGAFETGTSPSGEVPVAPVVVPPVWRRSLPFVATAAVVAGVLLGAVWAMWPSLSRPVVRSVHVLPEGRAFRNTGRPVLAIAPDGQHFVYNGGDGLYLRALDTVADRRIPGTEGALANPALSPDGQSVVYFDVPDTHLKRIAVSGGASLPLTDATNPFGISWEADGTILYGQPDGIWQVPENSGDPQHLITTEAGEQAHGPQRLPGGDWILFTLARTSGAARWDEAEIVVASPATGERRVVLTGGSDARYLPTGHVVYAFEDVLYAVAFDVDRLERRGGQVPVVQGVRRALAPNANTGAADFSVAADGTLVYVPGAVSGTSLGSLVLLDRTGTATPVPAPPRDYFGPRVSPDGTRIAVEETEGTSTHIAIVTVDTGVAVRLTFEGTRNWYPVWTPDSQAVVFASNRGDGEGEGIYRKAADGSGEAELVFEDEGPLVPTDVSRDGVLAFLRQGEGSRDIWTLPLDEGGDPFVFLATPATEFAAQFSPDGRWIAYSSRDGSGTNVYARPYPRTAGDLQLISEGAGVQNRWSSDGATLYYFFYPVQPLPLLAAPIQTTPRFARGAVQEVGFALLTKNLRTDLLRLTAPYDVMPDGTGFVGVQAGDGGGGQAAPAPQIIIVQHWFEELTRVVPTN